MLRIEKSMIRGDKWWIRCICAKMVNFVDGYLWGMAHIWINPI